MKIFKISENDFEENCYIVLNEKDATIIDPGFNYAKIVEYFESINLIPNRILLTHGHIDHIGDIDKLSKKYENIPIFINEHDLNMLFDCTLNCSKQFNMTKIYSNSLNIKAVINNEIVECFKFINTPGHTKGSSLIYIEKINDGIIFSGDTLFKNSVGRTDLPTGSIFELNESLNYIKDSFSKNVCIFPGHYGKTYLKDELKNNIYLSKKGK